jgi:hypothetical protein
MKAPFVGVVLGVLAACSFRPPGAAPDDGPGGDDAPIADAADADAGVDAAADAAADAAPFVCAFPGVQCPGNVPLQILACGGLGECWVGCVNGDVLTPAQAMQFCANLGMTLGAFDSATDEMCVRDAGINGFIMLGLRQLANQQSDDEGWVRVIDNMPAAYLNWDAGQPNDGTSGAEDAEEQCAGSNTSVQWHDIPCTAGGSARWICRRPPDP